MDFTHRVELDHSFDDAIPLVKTALKDQGFGVLAEIDIQGALKEKLGVDARRI